MVDTKCKYLGLELKNPVVVSSSGLTSSVDKIKCLADAGAGAVVLKSVFEEQIINETVNLEKSSDYYVEMVDLLSFYLKEEYLRKYIDLIKEAKRTVSIPVIGSINCVKGGQWVDFAKRIEEAGADALELNIFVLPTNSEENVSQIEMQYLQIVQQVVSEVKIPVAVKVGYRFTNILGIVKGIEHNGAKGVVMFNRFYEPDIDIDSMSVVEADIFSTSSELRNSIRWVAMASSEFPKLDIASSTGVHTGADAVKMLLAGASVVEVCSVIYEHGMGVINEINDFIKDWMANKGFSSVSEFKGRLNYSNVSNPLAFERAQFMKYFASHE